MLARPIPPSGPVIMWRCGPAVLGAAAGLAGDEPAGAGAGLKDAGVEGDLGRLWQRGAAGRGRPVRGPRVPQPLDQVTADDRGHRSTQASSLPVRLSSLDACSPLRQLRWIQC
jgi:hypothetical protein